MFKRRGFLRATLAGMASFFGVKQAGAAEEAAGLSSKVPWWRDPAQLAPFSPERERERQEWDKGKDLRGACWCCQQPMPEQAAGRTWLYVTPIVEHWGSEVGEARLKTMLLCFHCHEALVHWGLAMLPPAQTHELLRAVHEAGQELAWRECSRRHTAEQR